MQVCNSWLSMRSLCRVHPEPRHFRTNGNIFWLYSICTKEAKVVCFAKHKNMKLESQDKWKGLHLIDRSILIFVSSFINIPSKNFCSSADYFQPYTKPNNLKPDQTSYLAHYPNNAPIQGQSKSKLSTLDGPMSREKYNERRGTKWYFI